MNLFGIVARGIRGRKRDSLTLGSVLFLSFLFLVLSSVLLSSAAYTAQQQRQAIYGNWQVLYHGADASIAAAYADTEGVAEMELLGSTMDGELIASIDQAVFDNAGFELLEGRLPEAEDEILLVQGRVGSDKALGERLTLTYEYDYMQTAILPDERELQSAVLEALSKPMELPDGGVETPEMRRTAFEAYVRAHYSYDAKNSVLRLHWPNGESSQLAMEPGTGEEAALEELFAAHYDAFFVTWAMRTSERYRTHSYRMTVNDLETYEDFIFRVQSGYQLTMLVGDGYQDRREQEIAYRPATELLTMYRSYTIVGVIAPYADHWDARGYHLPDAFVSEAAAAQQREAIRCAESYYLEGASGYESSSVLLFWDAEQDARSLAERLLPRYNAAQRPGVRLEGFAEDLRGGASGAVFGLDPESGQSIAYSATLSNGHYYLLDNGTWYFMGDDPNDPENMALYADKLLPYPAETVTVALLDEDNTRPFRINTYAYPAAGGTEESLQRLLSGVLVGVAACATFQIFWVQLRRRRTRLATLMAIGATDGQILAMLLLEVLLLLVVAGVTGVGLGFVLVHLLLGTVVQASYCPDWGHLWSGIGSAAAAVLLGALIPMLLALRTPLTGREQTSQHTLRLKEARGEPRMQRYWRIVLRSMTVNRGRTALQCAFAWLLATICLLTLFLCHNAFGDYRREVEQTARPDYELEAPYAMSGAYLRELLADSGLEGDCVYSLSAGNVYLHTDKLLAEDGSPIVRTLYQHPQGEDLFRTLEDGTPGFATRIVGAMEDSPLMEQLLSLVPEGSVDEQALCSGEACILLVPRYTARGDGVQTRTADPETLEEMSRDERAGALLELSFDPQTAALTEADTTIQAGDVITLTGYTQKPGDSGMVETVRTVQTRVAAVVSVLDLPMWPFSERESAYWVLSGNRLVYRIYERTGTRMTGQQAINHRVMAKLFYPDCYGRTNFYFTNPAGADGIAQDTAAANFAEEYGLDFENLRLLNERVYSDAVKTAMMFLLLGVEMLLVVLTILMATASSSVEQDRWRYGTLQAVGVGGGQLVRGQLLQALGVGLLACLAANLCLALVLVLSAVLVNLGQGAFGARVLMTLVRSLRDYPWGIHGLLCAGYLLLYVAAQSRPILRVSRADPIENIRS